MKYGVLIDQPHLADWHRRCLDRLGNVNTVECALFVCTDVDPVVGCSLPFNVPMVRAKTTTNGNIRTLDAGSDAAIAEAHLDFLLVLTPEVIRGNFISRLPYGAWTFRFGDAGDASSAAFWAMHQGSVMIDASLERLCTDPQRSIPLRSGRFALHVHSTSDTARTIDLIASRWPAQVCTDLLNGVASYVNGSPRPSDGLRRRRVTPGASLRVRLRSAFRRTRAISENLFQSYRWNIGVTRSTPLEIATSGRLPSAEWVPLRPDTYLADPFPIEVDARRYVACEEFDYKTRHGVISIAEVDDQGRCSMPAKAIVRPYHMSYPFLIEDGGRIYCVPESSEARKVSLYVADPFPTVWREEAVLIEDFPGVDNTLVRHDGRWWMFSMNRDESACGSLWIFHAPRLHGPWQPHENNPVKIDITSSRPAGPFFREGAVLYRPTQDCSDRYGVRVVILRVTALSPKEFREDVAAVIEPNQTGPYPRGFHTIGGWTDWSVVDGSRYSYSFPAMHSAAKYYASMMSRRLTSMVRRRRRQRSGTHDAAPRLRT